MVNWHCIRFGELSVEQLHDCIALRISVFIVEQNCPYPELDGKDKYAHFVFATNEKNEVLATCRILPPGISYPEVSIGRVCSSQSSRRTGIGKQLMDYSMKKINEFYGAVPVRISAQLYLEQFYAGYGFRTVTEVYPEDDIPHVGMLFEP